MNTEIAIHCMKAIVCEELCEECRYYGTTGTDHCEEDAIRMAIKALENQSMVNEILHEWNGEREKVIYLFVEEIITWLKGKKYRTVDETSEEMTEKFEKANMWELSRNYFIEKTIRQIAEIVERMKNGEITE